MLLLYFASAFNTIANTILEYRRFSSYYISPRLLYRFPLMHHNVAFVSLNVSCLPMAVFMFTNHALRPYAIVSPWRHTRHVYHYLIMFTAYRVYEIDEIDICFIMRLLPLFYFIC